MARTSVHCTREISVDPGDLWRVLRSFDISWHPGVARCDVLRSPEGSLVRVFDDMDGQTYEERRTYLSDTDRVVRYEMDHGIKGIQSYSARVDVAPSDGGSRVTWRADIAGRADLAEPVAEGTRAIFEAAFDALEARPKAASAKRSKLNATGAVVSRVVVAGDPDLGLRIAGDGGGATDTLVLFLHGIGGIASNWDQQISTLGADYNVAALDLRGYGESALGAEQTRIDDYCADILRVMAQRGANRLVLAGLSYGSWIATSFAMRFGDVLAGLILAGGCTGMSEADPQEREAFRVAREVPLNAGKTPADFAPAVVDVIAGPNAGDDLREEMRSSMASIPSATYRDALNCFCNPPERFDFARIDCPVLIFTGAHDRLASPTEIRQVSERILDARTRAGKTADVQFEVIADAGHLCNLEASDVTNALIDRFLARIPNVARSYRPSVLERQRAKRERIRQAAHDEFCENGYDGASMDRIATRADVSKPTLYQYFGGKDGLLEAVLDVGRMQIVAPLMSKDGPLVDRLWRFAWGYADFVLRPDMLSLARLILGEAARRPENAMAYHQNGPARAFEGLVEFVSEAVAAGDLVTDTPDLAAQNLWSLILSGPRDYCLHYVDHRPSEAELLKSIGHGLQVFLKSYGADPETQLGALHAHISDKSEGLKTQTQM